MKLYLDTNVLSRILEGELNALLEFINEEDFKIIVSYIHFEEIKQAGNNELMERLYSLLDENPFEYIKTYPDGHANFLSPSVHELREWFCEEKEFKDILNTSAKLAHKFIGGQAGNSFESIISEQKNQLMKLLDLGLDLETENHLKQKGSEVLDDLIATIEKNPVLTQDEFNGKYEFWDQLSILQTEIGDIEPPGVVQQIWQKIGPEINKYHEITIEEFFLRTKDIQGLKKSNITTDIVGIMTLLNFLSYGSDKKRKVFDKFQGSQKDAQHLSCAAYCSAFVSMDGRLIKKAIATFEFLRIGTLLMHLRKEGEKINFDIVYPFQKAS